MSQLLADLGEVDAATDNYLAALEIGKDKRWVRVWALRQVLSRLYALDATDQVIIIGEAALVADPDNTLALNDLAYNYATHHDAKKRNPRRAVELSRRSLALEPEDGNLWNTLGIALYRAGQAEETITALKNSIDLSGGGIFHDWLVLALAYEREGRHEEARAALRELATREIPDPDDPNSDLRPFLEEASKLFNIQLDL
jgi:tetratricopeptide (TPR) repeat protein